MTLSEISNNGDANSACTVREQDRYMPIANVIRIMRKVLPTHAKISDDAKETIQECVSEYISFITSEANDRCQREQRKTITAEDVLWAMSKLGFDEYIEPLTLYLQRYREFEGERGSIRGDPLVKRTMELAPLTAAAYAPATAFHHMAAAAAAAAAHHHHQAGFFAQGPPVGGPVPTMGDYFRDGSGVNSAHQQAAAMATFDPYAPYK
ncbi:Transcription factor [Macleaya cordata]|uniref:Transcription factor n=1 Tax=Macleaya cordata TaxID=56857 RepID=A0A200QK69_MACCD|nr:Transcription factor [Macleaya cordata]